MGRKGIYQDWISDEGLIKIEGWAKDGLTNEQIAYNIGINVGTLYEWIKKFNELNEALKKGKEVIDRQVENALLKKALGYEYTEVKEYIEKTDDGKTRKKIEKTTKHISGDTTAQIFWLKNRKPKEWRDKQEMNFEDNGNINITINTEEKESKLNDEYD